MRRAGSRLGLVALLLAGCAGPAPGPSAPSAPAPRPEPVTFARVAPIFFAHCARCHRPGGVAPFSLLAYPSARARADDIAEVTASRYMPPWLPEPGHGDFQGARRLAEAEIGLIRRWVADGAPEGDPAALPPAPDLPADWQLGTPDLVLGLPEPYPVPARGSDRFRNFVIPLPIAGRRFVAAVEIHPGDPRLVHHATITVDTTGAARRLDQMDAEPGYPGMEGGVAPDGHFIGWSPGRQATPLGEGLAWEAREGMDLVLQLHLVPTGRPERAQPRIGLYWAAAPPRHASAVIHLGATTIDIPAGEPAYRVEDELVLPVEADAIAIYPHAHHLAREMRVRASLPDGSVRSLLWIRHWDFHWQDEYRYARPVALPAGTRLRMEYVYDNSAGNPRNPHQPPRRVAWGSRSIDEMADAWLTVVLRRPADLEALTRQLARRDLERLKAGYAHRLAIEPDNFEARSRLGHILVGEGQPASALPHLETALRRRPDAWAVLHDLGVAHAELGAHPIALRYLRGALRRNSRYAATHASLATSLGLLGRLDEAVDHYGQALALRPDDALAHNNVAVLLVRLGRLADAERHYREALRLEPEDPRALTNLGTLLVRLGRPDEAVAALTQALATDPNHLPALYQRGLVLLELGRWDEAARSFEAVLRLRPDHEGAWRALERTVDRGPPHP